MMRAIHEFMDLKDVFSDFGTQDYEARVVLLEKKGELMGVWTGFGKVELCWASALWVALSISTSRSLIKPMCVNLEGECMILMGYVTPEGNLSGSVQDVGYNHS